MGLELNYYNGQTPLEEEEKEALRIKSISTRAELDEFEQNNIEKAIEWSLKRKYSYRKILTIEFIKEVHKRMFNEVWKWAGYFRKSNKNIGVDKVFIQIELQVLLDDCIFWVENNTYSNDEIAIRFKHRLVSIHPFSNGNGRHSRLCADILISHIFKKEVFSWGYAIVRGNAEARSNYISAIHQADKGNILPLVRFA